LKNSFNKIKKIKRIRIKLKITKILIEGWNWKKKNFNKSAKEKITNSKNEDPNEKQNIWKIAIEGLNWK
jgi:hypothetical protein